MCFFFPKSSVRHSCSRVPRNFADDSKHPANPTNASDEEKQKRWLRKRNRRTEKQRRVKGIMGNELRNAWLVRDRYNELITRLRSLAGSMHRAKTEKIATGRERRRKDKE